MAAGSYALCLHLVIQRKWGWGERDKGKKVRKCGRQKVGWNNTDRILLVQEEISSVFARGGGATWFKPCPYVCVQN